MNPRVAPLVRVVGGLSLALLCVQAGLQQHAGEQAEERAPTLEDLVRLPEQAPTPPEPARAALAPLPRFDVPSVHPIPVSCGAACGGFTATSGLFWGSADLPALHVSAPSPDDAAAARGADVPLAFAQAAAHAAVHTTVQAAPPASPDAAPQEPAWPALPPLPSAPGGRGVEPVVAALFEPDLTPPTDTEVATTTTDPQAEGMRPMAGPLEAHPTPEGADPSAAADPPASVGAPFKRSHQPGDKASGRPPAPLAQPPVDHPYAPQRVPANAPGPDGSGPQEPGPGSDHLPSQWPHQSPNQSPDQWPHQSPNQFPNHFPSHSPGQPTVFPGQPGHFPGQVPDDLPSPVPDWLAPSQDPAGLTPTLPLLEDRSVPDRVARGDPPDPLLSPGFDPVALPSDLADPALVTEPGALALLAIAALGLAAARRTRRPTGC